MLTVWLTFFVPWVLCFNFVNPKIAVIRINFGYCIFDTPLINCGFVPFFKGLWKVNISIFALDVLQMYELLLLLLVHPHPYSLEDNIWLYGKRWNQHSSKACSQTSEWKVGKYRRQQLLYQVTPRFPVLPVWPPNYWVWSNYCSYSQKLLCRILECFCKSKRVKQGLIFTHFTCVKHEMEEQFVSMSSLQSHGKKNNRPIHLFWHRSIVHVVVQLSRLCLLFWLSILFAHVKCISRLVPMIFKPCAQYGCFVWYAYVSVCLVVNYDSVTSVVNDYWASWWLWCRRARVLGSISCQSVSWPPCCCYCQLVVQVNTGPGLVSCIPYQPHVYSEVGYQGHLLLFHCCLNCYCWHSEIAVETWSKFCPNVPCQVLFPLQRWFDGTYRLLSRQSSSF